MTAQPCADTPCFVAVLIVRMRPARCFELTNLHVTFKEREDTLDVAQPRTKLGRLYLCIRKLRAELGCRLFLPHHRDMTQPRRRSVPSGSN
jgi:hypothetical protein